MSIIDTLSIALVARTSGWSKGLSRASKDLSRFSSDVGSTAGKIAGYAATLSGVAAAGGMVALVKHQADAIESAGSFAARLGTTTEALQGMRYAAEQSEIDVGTFDGAIQKLTKNSYAFGGASEEAQAALQDLGIDAQAFSNMPLDQKLLTLADRFSQMADAGRAAVDVQALMGKGGQPMLQLFAQGPRAIKDMVAQAGRLGLLFSNLDASKVDAASDAVNDAQKAFTGAANAVAIYLAPWVQVLAERFTAAATESGNFGQTVTTWMQKSAVAIGEVANRMNVLIGVWYLFESAINKVGEWAVTILRKMAEGVNWVTEKIPGFKQSAENKAQFDAGQQGLADMAEKFGKRAGEAFDEATTAFTQFNAGSGGGAIATWFEKLQSDAAAAADAAGNKPRPKSSGGLPDAVDRMSKFDPLGARGVNLRNTYFGALNAAGGSGGQKVNAPQLNTTNDLLRTISRKLGGPATAG